MQWDASADAGFTTGSPWIEFHPDFVIVNAAAQIDDPDSVLSHCRRLIALPHDEPWSPTGTSRCCRPTTTGSTLRTEPDGARLLVVANLSVGRRAS